MSKHEDKYIPFFNKVVERAKQNPEVNEPTNQLVNELEEMTIDLASLVMILWCRLSDMKDKCKDL
jgi:hypothetical protein